MTLETSYLKESEKDFKTYGKSLLIKLDSQPDEALKALNSLWYTWVKLPIICNNRINFASFTFN